MLAEPGPQTFSWLKVFHRLAIVESGMCLRFIKFLIRPLNKLKKIAHVEPYSNDRYLTADRVLQNKHKLVSIMNDFFEISTFLRRLF